MKAGDNMYGFIKNDLGFIRCNIQRKGGFDKNNLPIIETMTEAEVDAKNREMAKLGYIPVIELDCFVNKDYGAWMGSVVSFDSFIEQFEFLMERGYDLVLIPSVNNSGRMVFDVFCKNYVKIHNDVIESIQKRKDKRA